MILEEKLHKRVESYQENFQHHTRSELAVVKIYLAIQKDIQPLS
jgi:hypothetical protein